VLVSVGLISYPLYLWHWPLLSFVRISNDFGDPTRIARGGAVLLAFVLAWLTYRMIERPIRGSARPSRGALSGALALGLSVTVAIGLYTGRADGFPSRFPPAFQRLAQFKYDTATAYRENRCFLINGNVFSNDCIDAVEQQTAPLLFLWGDSHAAHLYPGLRLLQKERRFRIAQFTTGRCPPIVGTVFPEDPLCKEINLEVLKHVEQLRPDTVLLAADWNRYDLRTLDETVVLLRRFGIRRIVLLGSVPRWRRILPQLLLTYCTRDIFHRIPERTTFGLLNANSDVERALNEQANGLDVAYVSARDALCNQDGCLTRVGDDAANLTTLDFAHLTEAGSWFLVNQISTQLFTTPPALVSDRSHRAARVP
jgi:hypothetical protein